MAQWWQHLPKPIIMTHHSAHNSTHTAPHIHIAGTGEDLHFFHANGFPAGVYSPILKSLSAHFNCYALEGRATWQAEQQPTHKNWQIFADDLITFIEQKLQHPIIAVGHSLGASSTILAAVKRPDLFKALVLIEPAMVNLSMRLIMKAMPLTYIKKSKLVSGTANKADRWQTKDEYMAYIKKFKGYQLFPEETFTAFTQHAIKQNTQGEYELVFPNHWEAHNYTQPPFLMGQFKKLNKLNIPTLAIAGKENLFFSQKLWQDWQAMQPTALFKQEKTCGHLFPLEDPTACYRMIMQGLDELGIILK